MKTKTKQTTRTGTESEKWTSHREISVGGGEREEQGGKGTGNKQHNDRQKIDRGTLRIAWEMEKPKNV